MSRQASHSQAVAWAMSRSRRRNAKYTRSTVSSSCEPSRRSAITKANAASPSSLASRKVGFKAPMTVVMRSARMSWA